MDETLKSARKLYKLGLAIHWLRPKSKIPLEGGWSSGPRKDWEYLEKTYKPGLNVGVRLGTPSKIGEGYLAVIDVDVKGGDPRYRQEALAAVEKLTSRKDLPLVLSGRGNGSRHLYYASLQPFKTYTPFRSTEEVRAHVPSKSPSKRELAELSLEEIKKGIRLSPAWEVSLYSDGRQVVLPPSVHPDSGREYSWKREISQAIPLVELKKNYVGTSSSVESSARTEPVLEDFTVSNVELDWLDISDSMRDAIKTGKKVTDRSAFLMKASRALFSAGLTQNEVLSVLTDPETFLGACGYDHARTGSRKRAAEWVYRYTVQSVTQERGDISAFKDIPPPAKKLSKEEEAKQSKELSEERHWTQDLLKGKNGQILHQLRNIILILTKNFPENPIQRDDFSARDTYAIDVPWGRKKDHLIEDEDVANIKHWLGKEFNFEPSNNGIIDAITVLATQNRFDPIRDFLDSLPKWDKTLRLNSWLKKNFEAKGEPEYLAQVFRKWMVAMVMRIYEPGAKFDWMPIFEGKQNIGKSSFGKILVGEKYFCDSLPPLGDKEAALALMGRWGIEFGELTQFRKNELEVVKSFVSRSIDKFRPPYGRRSIEFARRCVFFGTTNKDAYLADETGNRRFKPLLVGRLNFEALKKDRLQLFAEAKYLWKKKKETGLSIDHLTGKAAEYETKIHAKKMVTDDSNVMKEQMLEFLEKVRKKEVNFDLEKFTILELFKGAGPLGGWRSDNRNHQFASKMLKQLGGEIRRIHGRRTWRVPGLPPLLVPTKKSTFIDDNEF